jgi:hypothetical protein
MQTLLFETGRSHTTGMQVARVVSAATVVRVALHATAFYFFFVFFGVHPAASF